MSANTPIEWTGRTWNPLVAYLTREVEVTRKNGEKVKITAGTRGWFCTKCSPGCAHCYAEKINLRLGNGLEYAVKNLAEIEFRLINMEAPLHWRKPGFVFVNSMTDLFHEAVPRHLIDQVFAVMALAQNQTFQVLTKRSKEMREYLRGCDDGAHFATARPRIINHVARLRCPFKIPAFPLPNVWLGVSAENQKYWNERVPDLIKTPAAVRFVSAEPLLDSIDISSFVSDHPRSANEPRLNWIIVGGESGPKSRPCNVHGIRRIMEQCRAEQVAVFVKQLGATPYDYAPYVDGDPHFAGWTLVHINDDKFWSKYYQLKDRKGGDMSEWPEEFRVRQMPEVTNGKA